MKYQYRKVEKTLLALVLLMLLNVYCQSRGKSRKPVSDWLAGIVAKHYRDAPLGLCQREVQ